MSKSSARTAQSDAPKPQGTAETITPGQKAQPQPFAFGAENYRPMSALPALDRIGERMAKRLRDVIEPFARTKPRITAAPVAIQRFETWRGEKPEFTSLNLYRFRPLKGGLLVTLQPDFISMLVDSFYGGTGTVVSMRAEEFTATEERLLVRLVDTLMASLAEAWSEVVPATPQFVARETNTTYATLVHRDEPVAVTRFTIVLPQGSPSVIDIVYPVSSIRAVEAELSSRVQDDTGMSGGDWRDRMAAALGEVRLDARSVLARPTMQINDLLKLAPGDLIPISLPTMVPLLVAGRVIAHGTIGDNDGRAALKIEKMAHRSSK
jgi:flagellar motor switch protein FliM